jgi:hypothetical protein
MVCIRTSKGIASSRKCLCKTVAVLLGFAIARGPRVGILQVLRFCPNQSNNMKPYRVGIAGFLHESNTFRQYHHSLSF